MDTFPITPQTCLCYMATAFLNKPGGFIPIKDHQFFATVCFSHHERIQWTGGVIYDDGIVMDEYTYLASTWAVPLLKLDGDVVECYRMEHEVPGWDANTKWVESARRIIEGK